MKIVVVGAGISGCVCAYRLATAGHEVTLIEKGRGVGGRMATRRMDGARIDHGAQFFTVKDERMKSLLADWQAGDAVLPWYDKVPGRDDLVKRIRYRGRAGMTGPAKILAESFKFEKEFFVESISRGEQWEIFEREGLNRKLVADHLVLTMPVPQILELLERSQFKFGAQVMDNLAKVRYTRCLAVLGIMNRSSGLSMQEPLLIQLLKLTGFQIIRLKEYQKFLPVPFMHPMNILRNSGTFLIKTGLRF